MKIPIIIILHGWGKKGSDYSEIQKKIQKKGFIVHSPDLPGFGSNNLKKKALIFDDYVRFLYNYIVEYLKEKNVILIGHSFGGRLAIRFTSLYPQYVSVLILTGASGIPRPLPSLKKKIVFYTTKLLRPFFLIPIISLFYSFFRKLVYYSIGEIDYYKSGSLRQTFKNVYQVSILGDLKKIKTKTLIIWGEKDKITPLADAELIYKYIDGSKLIVVPNGTHKLPYSDSELFSNDVVKFINN